MRITSVLALTILSLTPSLHALPAPVPRFTRDLCIRQNNNGAFSGPQTVHTVNTANTSAGTVTTTCEVTLTPVQGPNGENLVQEEQNCQITVNSQDDSTSSSTTSSDTSGSSASTSSSDTTSGDTSTDSTSSDSSSSTTTSTGSNSDSTTTASSSSGGVASVQGVVATESILSAAPEATGAAVSGSGSGSSSTSTSTSGSGSGAVVADGFTTVTGTETPSTTSGAGSGSSSGTGTAADDTAATATSSAFAIPGRSLQVLPIGLGVFAGISVIALIVVGLVTYERTKYRRAFRQRRLAEQGAQMGYGGGMSQA